MTLTSLVNAHYDLAHGKPTMFEKIMTVQRYIASTSPPNSIRKILMFKSAGNAMKSFGELTNRNIKRTFFGRL